MSANNLITFWSYWTLTKSATNQTKPNQAQPSRRSNLLLCYPEFGFFYTILVMENYRYFAYLLLWNMTYEWKMVKNGNRSIQIQMQASLEQQETTLVNSRKSPEIDRLQMQEGNLFIYVWKCMRLAEIFLKKYLF